jgi:hypothetical protein
MEEHNRDTDPKPTQHHRHSDDLIIELLDIVQRIDSRLEAHIREEMGVLTEVVADQNERFQNLVDVGFPKADPVHHKASHESVWYFIRSFFK